MNKIALKTLLEEMYCKSLGSENHSTIIATEAIKSLIGINLEKINRNLVDWLAEYVNQHEYNEIDIKQKVNMPEAISFYSLEESILKKDYAESKNNVINLSHVSEGTQVFEFLLEFSLKNCKKNYIYIWHIYRMNLFLSNKFLKESLLKSVELIIKDLNPDLYVKSDDLFNISDYLSLYQNDLIRSGNIKKIITSRLLSAKITSKKVNEKNDNSEQVNTGRKWILNYLNSLSPKHLNFNMLIYLNSIRSAIKASLTLEDQNLLWAQLNMRINNLS